MTQAPVGEEEHKAKRVKQPRLRSSKLQVQTLDEAWLLFQARLKESATASRWLQSAVEGRPIDRRGRPVPWYTYPMLHFLNTRSLSQLSVFEYGSGHSTLWWARQAKFVASVEHDERWFESIASLVSANVDYRFCTLEYGGEYGRSIYAHENRFDIVVIDGRDRNYCALQCLERGLSDKGVFIWDNSERPRYRPGRKLLVDAGYKQLDFFGYGPVNVKPWNTSIFYKADNCLDI